MRERILRFRQAARRENAGRRRRRYSVGLRREAVGMLSASRLEGSGRKAVARELGIGAATLERWAREVEEARGGAPFRRVEVRSERQEARAGLRLVTPRGFAVDGLDLESVAALLGAL